MRWMLAGISFAMLTGLAVLTVAIKARNFALRASIATANQRIMALRVERARRVPHLRPEAETDELILRFREFNKLGLAIRPLDDPNEFLDQLFHLLNLSWLQLPLTKAAEPIDFSSRRPRKNVPAAPCIAFGLLRIR